MQAEAGASLNSLTAVPDEAVGPARRGVSRAPLVLGIAVLVYLLDRATKSWALANLVENEPRDFLGSVLRLRLIFNPGAAFSLATGLTWVLSLVAVVVVGVVLCAARRMASVMWAIALGLLLGGALGNLVDRLLREPGFGRGEVVDFISYNGWFVGNVADVAIVVAAVLVALLALRGIEIDGSRSGRSATDDEAEAPVADDADEDYEPTISAPQASGDDPDVATWAAREDGD